MRTYQCTVSALTYSYNNTTGAVTSLSVQIADNGTIGLSAPEFPNESIASTVTTANGVTTYTGSFGTIIADGSIYIQLSLSGTITGNSIGSIYGIPYEDYIAPGTYNCSLYMLENVTSLSIVVDNNGSVTVNLNGSPLAAVKTGETVYLTVGTRYTLTYFNNNGTDVLYGTAYALSAGNPSGCFVGYTGSVPSAIAISTANGIKLTDANITITPNANSGALSVSGNVSAVTRYSDFAAVPPNVAPVQLLIYQVVSDLRSQINNLASSSQLAGLEQLSNELATNTDLNNLLSTLGQIQNIANQISTVTIPTNQVIFETVSAASGESGRYYLKTSAGAALFPVYTY